MRKNVTASATAMPHFPQDHLRKPALQSDVFHPSVDNSDRENAWRIRGSFYCRTAPETPRPRSGERMYGEYSNCSTSLVPIRSRNMTMGSAAHLLNHWLF